MKIIRIFKVDNGMPELKIKPSRLFIPDMEANQTQEQRAKFLMRSYQYTEVIFDGTINNRIISENKDYQEGLYILKDTKSSKVEYFFLTRHKGYSILKQNMFYVCIANGSPKKAILTIDNNQGLFELAVQIELGIIAKWKESFNPMELVGLSKGIWTKYIKDGSYPKRLENIRALNYYLDFIKMQPKIKKEVQKRLLLKEHEKEMVQEINLEKTEVSNLNFKIKAVDNGMPELKVRPSRLFIPDMESNQTAEQRAKFLMSRYKYFLCKFNDYIINHLRDKEREHKNGLYILLDENNNVHSHIFLTNKKGNSIIKQDSYYIILNNSKVVKSFLNLFDVHVQINITGWEKWRDCFNPFELLGITEVEYEKYMKFGIQSRTVDNTKAYNEYTEYVNRLPELENVIKEKQIHTDTQRVKVEENRQIKDIKPEILTTDKVKNIVFEVLKELKENSENSEYSEEKINYEQTTEIISSIQKLERLPVKEKLVTQTIVQKMDIAQRDRSNVDFVLNREKYTCQNNRSHKTYRSGTTGQQLMHVHHLIPMKYQYLFDFSLDVPNNMFSLCPNCHEGIHHGDRTVIREIVTELYTQRGYKLPLTLEHILELYYK